MIAVDMHVCPFEMAVLLKQIIQYSIYSCSKACLNGSCIGLNAMVH